jgi:serine/threonine-protein kinase
MPSDVIGKTVSHYQVIEVLGAGGMGVVYKAKDLRLPRHVALKFVSTTLAEDPLALRQFEREARTASVINHPNICTIYEVDEWQGEPFIAMELLDGQTVKERLAGGPVDVSTIIDTAVQVASALGAAHERGILHRDVKPANIFITREGQVKLLDFGLAKEGALAPADPGSSTGFTAVGRLLGTANYMAPERLRGRVIDHRCDLFSLGAVIHEMMSGKKAFEGDSVIETIDAILHEDPPLLDATSGPWPRALIQIVTTLLQKDANDRYQSAAALTTALLALREELAAGRAPMVMGSPATWRTRASIAVLPFRNLSAEPDHEYFADGLAEELITALAKIEQLRVAAKASAFTFKGRNAELREIGARLNVETVLSGTVRRSETRLRVACRLTSVADGSQIWSERYDREAADIFTLQDDITRAIVETLKVTLADRLRPTRRYTDNRDSYHHYLKGRFYWAKRYEGGLKKAMEEFQAAIDRDSQHALAYAGQADAYAFLGLYGLMPPRAAYGKAKQALATALSIDPALPEAQTSLGLIALSADWDWKRAEAALIRAVELDKTQALAYLYYGWLLALTHRRAEALVAAKKAQDADPLAPLINSAAGWMHFLLRDFDQAIVECQKCVEVDPNFLVGLYVMSMAHIQKQQHAEAMPLILRATELSGRAPFYLGLLGQFYAETGQHDEVAKILAELEDRATRSYVPPHCFVYIHASRGDKDQAFAWQEKACEDGAPPFYFMSPAIGSLFDDPRHQTHLARMGATSKG